MSTPAIVRRSTLAVAATAALVSSGPAVAQTAFSSEPADVLFAGASSVLDQNLVVPIGVNIGFIVDYIGVDLRVTASSDLAVRMEGQSEMTWPDPTGEGTVRQYIEPLPGGSEIAMTSRVGFVVAFVIDVFGSRYSFNLLSQDITFSPNVDGFAPFLLPGQDPSRIRVDADPTGGQFRIPFNFDIFDIGILGVGLGVVFTGTPITYSIVNGVGLDLLTSEGDRYRVTDPLLPTSLDLYENNGRVDLAMEYVVDTNTAIGYRFTGEGGVDISILGQNIPIYITFLDQTLNLFTGSERATYESGAFSHPIPEAEFPVPSIDFGTLEVGDVATFTVPVRNDGELDLQAVTRVDIDTGPFSVQPPDLFAISGGQDAAIVTFEPTEVGDFSAKLQFVTSDPLTLVYEIPIHGTAVRPEVEPPTGGGGGGNGDDGGIDGGVTTLYSGCGCDAGGGWTVAWAPALLALSVVRRRRSGALGA